MYISAVTPRPVSSRAITRWLIVAAALALAGLIAAVVGLSDSNRMPGPGPTSASASPAPVHTGYFRDLAMHVLPPLTTRAIQLHETSGAVSHPRR
jgi:hypothetical protein